MYFFCVFQCLSVFAFYRWKFGDRFSTYLISFLELLVSVLYLCILLELSVVQPFLLAFLLHLLDVARYLIVFLNYVFIIFLEFYLLPLVAEFQYFFFMVLLVVFFCILTLFCGFCECILDNVPLSFDIVLQS